jgi:hypothetical protein
MAQAAAQARPFQRRQGCLKGDAAGRWRSSQAIQSRWSDVVVTTEQPDSRELRCRTLKSIRPHPRPPDPADRPSPLPGTLPEGPNLQPHTGRWASCPPRRRELLCAGRGALRFAPERCAQLRKANPGAVPKLEQIRSQSRSHRPAESARADWGDQRHRHGAQLLRRGRRQREQENSKEDFVNAMVRISLASH